MRREYLQRVVVTFHGALHGRQFDRDSAGVAAELTTTNRHQRSTVQWTAVRRKLCAKRQQPLAAQLSRCQNANDEKSISINVL